MILLKAVDKEKSFSGDTVVDFMFSDINFFPTNEMVGTRFKNCIFVHVQFEGQILDGAIFENCIFEDVNIIECGMDRVSFINCKYQEFRIHEGKDEWVKL